MPHCDSQSNFDEQSCPLGVAVTDFMGITPPDLSSLSGTGPE